MNEISEIFSVSFLVPFECPPSSCVLLLNFSQTLASVVRTTFTEPFSRSGDFDKNLCVVAMADIPDDLLKEKNPPPLDEDDIALLKTYVCHHDSLSARLAVLDTFLLILLLLLLRFRLQPAVEIHVWIVFGVFVCVL